MLIPPTYFLNSEITALLGYLEANKEVVNSVSIPAEIEQNIRRRSTLKSSVFSARIEGNPTGLEEFARLGASDRKKIEINNILKAINWVYERPKKQNITFKDILTLHKIAMKGIEYRELGKFRSKHEGIFTTGGVVVYHAPPPGQINVLVKRLLKYSNSGSEKLKPVKAILSHFVFEKIHPFTDGSGRVGRLLMLMMLNRYGYGFKGILPFEEKIDKKRETYYRMLEEPERDLTEYVEFMLTTLVEASDEAKKAILAKEDYDPAGNLLPRRAEIFEIVKDQQILNFDSIRRRFSKVNERTLRYDLKKLQEDGFIQKLGTTRGVYYKLKV